MKDLSVKQVAVEIGLSRDTVKRLISTDQIKGYNAAPSGARKAAWRVTRQSLAAFKEARRGRKPYRQNVRRNRVSGVKEFV
ncbi:MAG: helix-turn-helix domain-containing protein [Fuerstiella sp.]|nr:helix-turn-helix domain-containing protein [Fuerstiella sp.]MCP4853759.1 helix-turn-helix domain-containing protein [Fuerstiella sp.]